MPKFQIWGDSIAEVVETLNQATPPVDAPKMRAGGRETLLDFFPAEKLKGTKFVGTQRRKISFAQLPPDDQTALIDLVADKNPFVFVSPNDQGGFDPDPDPSAKVLVTLDADPSALGVSAKQQVQVPIGVFEDGSRAAQHRAPGLHGGATFRRRSAAMRQIGDNPALRHHPVSIFLVDQGIDQRFVNALYGPKTYAGKTWKANKKVPVPQPGELPTELRDRYRSYPQWHGHMMLRNIMACAGDNWGVAGNPNTKRLRVFDIPVLPDRVGDTLQAAERITMQMEAIFTKINKMPAHEHKVVVNAWGVKNRLREVPLGGVTEDFHHQLNKTIHKISHLPNTTVVFAVGNSGQFSPDPETSPLDRGAGRSIWLPAALPKVWNTAACDVNGMWVGSSSQGPSGWSGAKPINTPAFAIPSFFHEDTDAHAANTGSSASCGLLAGMIAAQYRAKIALPINKINAQGHAKKFGFNSHCNRLGLGVAQGGKLT